MVLKPFLAYDEIKLQTENIAYNRNFPVISRGGPNGSQRIFRNINEKDESKFLVIFKIDKELPLVGAGG